MIGLLDPSKGESNELFCRVWRRCMLWLQCPFAGLDLWSSQVHRHQANNNTKNKYSLKFMTFKAQFELWIMQLQKFIMMNPSWRGMKLFLKNINTTATNHRELELSITSSCFFTQYSHIEIRENGTKKKKTISFKIEIEREGEKFQKQFSERQTKTPKFRHYNTRWFFWFLEKENFH